MIAYILALMLQATAPVSSMTAQNAKETTPPPEAKTGADGVTCWKEAVLGSRMKRRVCAREGDLEARRNDDRDLIDKAQKLQTIK